MDFAKCYYQMAAKLTTIKKFDIFGHFDILTKNNELKRCLDVESKECLNYAKDAITSLKGKIEIFEVNIGANLRRYSVHQKNFQKSFL